jgi:hypothetical protein
MRTIDSTTELRRHALHTFRFSEMLGTPSFRHYECFHLQLGTTHDATRRRLTLRYWAGGDNLVWSDVDKVRELPRDDREWPWLKRV